MKLVWSTSALADRRSIFSYIERSNPAAAAPLDASFSSQARLLLTHPHLGRPGRRLTTRELVVHPNYVIIYRQIADKIIIVRVLHVARQWP